MIRLRSHLIAAAILAVGLSPPTAAQDNPNYGPPNGTLVIAGGGSIRGTEILERFIELGGGVSDGMFVVVPTAGGNYDKEGSVRVYDEALVLAPWRDLGVSNVSMLHTHDTAVADSEEFIAVLQQATAVWFNGGRQWRIVDSYAGTRTYEEFHKVLERGGVIGGSSAGATIQGTYLVRGDTSGPDIVMTDEVNHQRGFAFLRRSAIDQHVDTRNRWDDLVPVIDRNPELLGIGISERTAVVVTGDTFKVIGLGAVAVHDRTRAYEAGEKPYFLLNPGERFDMELRAMLP